MRGDPEPEAQSDPPTPEVTVLATVVVSKEPGAPPDP